MSEEGISTGKFSRSASFGMAATKIGLKHLGRKGKNSLKGPENDADRRADQDRYEAEIGKILFQALNQLKGTALKASQILSLEVDFLPKGVRAELAKACHQVTPLNKALVHKVFRQAFQTSPHDLFETFEDTAFAAASLGQVHRARLADGSDVAVKIQYPGIAASIKSDITLLDRLLSILSSTTDLIPDRKVIRIILTEIEHQLAREVDYHQEAAHVQWFRDNLSLAGIILPATYPDHSSERVLTMQYLDGLHLDDWLATDPDQASRDHYSQLLFDLSLKSFFDLGCIHADPHPGNFLFMADSELGLIDFGCVKNVDPGFAAQQADFYNLLIRHQSQPDPQKLHELYFTMGLIDEDLDLQSFQDKLQPYLQGMQAWCIEPFQTPRFDFTQKTPVPVLDTHEARQAMKFLKGMPRDLLYFDRTYHGLVHMLKKIGGRVVTENPWIGPDLGSESAK
tara:strand:- start:5671 stop:7032 length:1362 start_codon:yes stop_codon:yes gene_type:complete